MSRMFISSMARRMISLAQGEPPMKPPRRLLMSNWPKAGWLRIAISIVGTPRKMRASFGLDHFERRQRIECLAEVDDGDAERDAAMLPSTMPPTW